MSADETPAPSVAPAVLRQAALVFSASLFLNVGGFIFHAMASRYLGVDRYGQLYALISACTDAALPVMLLSPVIARFAAEFAALHDESHMRAMAADVARLFGIIGAIGFALSILFAVPAGAFLHVPAWSVPMVGLTAATLLMSMSLRAIAQGTQAFGAYAGSLVAEGTFKVVVLGAFIALGFGLAGSMLGFFGGVFAGFLLIGFLCVRRYANVPARAIRYDWKRIALSGAGAAALTVAMTLVGTADVLVVKHFFDAQQAGLYSAASLGGKIMMYFVGFIPLVLLPQATDRHVRGERTRYTLFAALGLFSVVAVFVIIKVKFYGIVLLHALVGRAFDAANGLLVSYTLAMLFLALMNLLASYGIATHRLAFAVPLLVGTAATLLSMLFFHASLAQVVAVLTIGMAATVSAVAIAVIWQGFRSTRRGPVSAI
ncbi:MAG: oligosaccharide flippase family protein [Candidatus Eremiobacteraeota bacterium]|nr:oligosaccharide flippase family protein [Candidatus Eremiobacteraeota bacterium]